MSPASERGDRRLRRGGLGKRQWRSGRWQTSPSRKGSMAKAPSSMVKRLQRGNVSSNGRTCDRVRPCKMKVRIFPFLALCLLSEEPLFQRSSSARN